jgi:hypothetical protein
LRYLLFLILSSCIGYGEFISPMDAYRIERDSCQTKRGSEEVRKCMAGVNHKYGQYMSEGSYPETRSPRPCGGSADCR